MGRGGGASDGAQDRRIHPEEERAGGLEEPYGLAGKVKEADPCVPYQILPGHLGERIRSQESRYPAPHTIPAAPA